ncbi:MAG: hypothetical protein Q4D88_02055 [Anaerococcus sp.]|nr:hypothetical protein [Anaerococcus sp.]
MQKVSRRDGIFLKVARMDLNYLHQSKANIILTNESLSGGKKLEIAKLSIRISSNNL